jgi:hypothetical protein
VPQQLPLQPVDVHSPVSPALTLFRVPPACLAVPCDSHTAFVSRSPALGTHGPMRRPCRTLPPKTPSELWRESLGMQSQTAGVRPKPSATALVKIPHPPLQESGEMLAGDQLLPTGKLFSCGTP